MTASSQDFWPSSVSARPSGCLYSPCQRQASLCATDSFARSDRVFGSRTFDSEDEEAEGNAGGNVGIFHPWQLQAIGLIKGDRRQENAMKRAKNRANQMVKENEEYPESLCGGISSFDIYDLYLK